MDDLCKLTRELWNIYFTGEEETGLRAMEELLDPSCVIIGTGRHEFYRKRSDFAAALCQEVAERQNIQFQFRDFWCDQSEISPDVSLVYGGLCIWWESEDRKVKIDMDSRFSIVYRRTGDRWRAVHIHQSIPNLDQMDGEYYPKTLSEQVKESREKIEELTVLAERDSLTGLINLRTFRRYYQRWDRDNAWLFIVDVDRFKQINDVHGHVAGNHVLEKIAGVLESTVRSSDLVCRMGGDEFLILCSGFDTEGKAGEFMHRLGRRVEEAGTGEPAWTGISVGMAHVGTGESLESALARADSALYREKHIRHGTV
ncbi:diguanylate cyclase domain-containing protein [uncultured Oscillibacter sp.]|uniref:GGDEF domain-containing protein n=1 Tax=uncultured Oscillibacter sp. TaxID=876091 RepID=UPI0025F7189D|nr:diguanylate cyclase [uncultured Oscillibacter sp.]